MPSVRTRLSGNIVLSQSAIELGGMIKNDKVRTSAMTDNAATVMSNLYRNDGGSTLGTAGSYVNLPGGAATISIVTGSKAAQQCFIDAWVGVRRGGGANDMVTFRCLRNDAVVLAQTYTQEVTNDQAILPMAFLDPDPAVNTTHTYTIQANSDDTATQIREVFVKGVLGTTG